MVATINASVSSSGIVSTADGSGILKVQSNGVTTNALAWVNFGYVSSVMTTRSSYNVSSVTRNNTGIYTINFTTSTSDANYCVTGSTTAIGYSGVSAYNVMAEYLSSNNTYGTKTTSAVQVSSGDNGADTFIDAFSCNVAIFGN